MYKCHHHAARLSSISLPYTMASSTPPLGRISKVDCSTTKRMPKHRTIRLRKASARCFPTPNFFGTDTTLTGLWRYRAWKIGLRVCDIPAGVRCSSSVTSILQQQGLRVADGKNLHVLFSTRFSSETSCPYCCTHCLPLCAARLGSSGFKVVRARYQYSMKLSAINCQGGCSCSHYMSQ